MNPRTRSIYELSLCLTGFDILDRDLLPVLDEGLVAAFGEPTVIDFLEPWQDQDPVEGAAFQTWLAEKPVTWKIAQAIILFWYNGTSADASAPWSPQLYRQSQVWPLLGATPPGIPQGKLWPEPPV